MPVKNPFCENLFQTWDGLALKIDNDKKIVELGLCPDFAFCKSTRKNDGHRCSNVVNKCLPAYRISCSRKSLHIRRSVSDVCDYHVSAAVKRFASKRGEFQSGTNARPKKFAPRSNCGVLLAASRGHPPTAASKCSALTFSARAETSASFQVERLLVWPSGLAQKGSRGPGGGQRRAPKRRRRSG